MAARRIDLLNSLAEVTGGHARTRRRGLRGDQPSGQRRGGRPGRPGCRGVHQHGGIIPFAYIEDTDVATWLHAFSVNTVGANNALRAAAPRLAENGAGPGGVQLRRGSPAAGVAAYSASKAALDEILHSWRIEHPELSLIRVGVGPTDDTEILRGADRDLLDQLVATWVAQGALLPDVGPARRRREYPGVSVQLLHRLVLAGVR